jgi:general L-amino acid transport system substrate-binding protein
MTKLCKALLLLAAAVALAASAGLADTLDDVKARAVLKCGVHIEKAGFSNTDAKGNIVGFDVDFCHAIAAALGVGVEFHTLSPKQRFTALTSGTVDLLIMTTTQTMNRDTKVGADWAFINFYGGAQFMVRRDLGVKSARELNGASICLSSGTTGEQIVADYFRSNKMTYKQVLFERLDDGFRGYVDGRCDVFVQDDAALATMRSTLPNPQDHVILPQMLSKEPVGAVTRQNDSRFTSAARWVFMALVNAEEAGITQANVEQVAKSSQDPDIRRMLGQTGSLGPDAGLPQDWAVRAIGKVGSYGEIFKRHLGEDSSFKMERGVNDLWTRGGLIYGFPIR